MIAGTVVALVLIAAASVWIARPLFGRRAADLEERSITLGRARELQSRREQLVASLKDLEDDRATAKVDEADYADLRARLEGEAIEVLRELDAVAAERSDEIEADRRAHEPLLYPGSRGSGRTR